MGDEAAILVGPAKAQVAAVQTAANRAMTMQRTRGLSVVSRIKGDFGAGTGSTATADVIAVTARIRHQNLTGKRLISVAPMYAHWAPAGGTEAATAQPLLIKAGIEIGGTATDQTKRKMAKKDGRSSFILDRYCVTATDEFHGDIAPSAYFYEATGVGTSGATGTYARHQIALGGTPNFGRDTGEGASTADLAQGPSAISINTSAAFSAVGMLGRTIDGTIAQSICIAGDSTSVGYWDGVYGPNNGGWPWRACQNWPGMSIGCAGERLQQQVDPATFFVRFEIARWHTHILDCTLINDVTQSRTVAQMQADVLAQAYKFMSRGINYLKATCAPLADSTDGWFTVANQTPRANEANRVGINNWLRDTSASGFVSQANAQVATIPGAGRAFVIEMCAAYEVDATGALALNGGRIKAPGVALYTGTATAGSTTSLTNIMAAWPVNGLAGKVVRITGGTGAGQVGVISYNTATTITLPFAFFATSPDATSTYTIYDGYTVDGTHMSGIAHAAIAADVQPRIAAVMAETA
jgi:hypothetical protein